MTSVFDANTFASLTFTEANTTEYTPVPAGDWPAVITKATIKPWAKRDDPTQNGLKCELSFSIEDPEVAKATGRPKSTVKYEFMLELTPEKGLDFGRGMNVALGRARAACGLNKAGQPFSFDMFVGHDVTVSVRHREWEGRPIAEVSGMA